MADRSPPILAPLARSTDGPGARRALELYARWERQQWSATGLDLETDAAGWSRLGPFVRGELLAALRQFSAGELAVTRVLTPIVESAALPGHQLFLCTQLADEARHALFFERYLAVIDPDFRADASTPSTMRRLFEEELGAVSDRVRRRPGAPGPWYEAVTTYHGVAEGVLAISMARSVLDVLGRLGVLPALRAGMTGVGRDEARHVAFGVAALREGVRTGYEGAIRAAFLRCVPLVARILVDPERSGTLPTLPSALRTRARQLEAQWGLAWRNVERRLESLGLGSARDEAAALWTAAQRDAVDRYEDLHRRRHPVRVAGEIEVG